MTQESKKKKEKIYKGKYFFTALYANFRHLNVSKRKQVICIKFIQKIHNDVEEMRLNQILKKVF